jgi:HEPN domain-containing protein
MTELEEYLQSLDTTALQQTTETLAATVKRLAPSGDPAAVVIHQAMKLIVKELLIRVVGREGAEEMWPVLEELRRQDKVIPLYPSLAVE